MTDNAVSAYPAANIARDVAGQLAADHLRRIPPLGDVSAGARGSLVQRCVQVRRPDLANSLYGQGDTGPGQRLVELLKVAFPALLEELERHALHGPTPTLDAYKAACAALHEHRERLAEVGEVIAGIVENGPWALIPDPALREVVRAHIADACHTIACAAGLDEAMQVAHDACPVRLPTTLPATSTPTDPEE